MRRIKYILTVLLLSVASVFVSEFYIFHLDNFQGKYYHTTFYKPYDISNQEMNEEVQMAADNHHVQIFAIKKEIHSTIRSDITVYGNSEVIQEIKKSGVLLKNNHSLFLGHVNISTKPYVALQNNESGHDYYLIGEPDNLYQFKQALVTKYAGGFPREGAPANEGAVVGTFLAVVLSLILFLTFYEIQFLKKEVLLRTLMGESIRNIIFRRIGQDISVFCIIYVICFVVTSPFHHSLFHFKANITTFIAFLLLNSLCYLLLLIGNPKHILSSTHGKRILTLNYGLKAIVSVLSILAVTAMATFINQGINFYEQKDMISKHKNYSYVQLSYHDPEKYTESVEIQETFYKTFQLKSMESVNIQETTQAMTNFDYPVIKMNTGYIPNLPSEIQQQMKDDFVYILIPHKLKSRHLSLEEFKNAYSRYEYEHPDFQVIYYDVNIKVFNSKSRYYPFKTWLEKNPIMMLNNSFHLPEKVPDGMPRLYIAYDFMYDITDQEYEQFISTHKLENELHIRTNVEELYLHNWTIIKRSMYISIILLSLILLLNTFVISTILRMEYTLNAKQLLLMKLFGNSIWARNKKIILLTVLTSLASTITAITISLYLHLPHIKYLLIGSVMLFVVEMVVLLFNIGNVEKHNLVKILKGGFL